MGNAAQEQTGLDTSKLDEKAVDDALERLDITPSDDLDLEGKARVLVETFAEGKHGELVSCGTCNGASPLSLPRCPFCGDEDKPEDEEEPADGELAPDAGPVEDPSPELTAAARGEPIPPPPPESKPRLVKSTKNKDPKAPKAAAKKSKKDEAPAVSAEIVPATKQDLAGVALLDRDVQEVKQLDRTMRGHTWQLACKLVEIDKSQRWKLRQVDGKVAYRTFEEFANAELDITRQYAQDLLRIATKFNEAEVIELGPTKLRVVMQAPPAKQPALLEKFKKGASRREVERDLKPKSQSKDLGGKGKASKAPKVEPKGGKITVAAIEGRKTIKLFRKPEGRTPDATKLERATKIDQLPWGTLDLANDVRMYLTVLKDNAGELVIKADIRRVDPA